jgi:hypothetical protein
MGAFPFQKGAFSMNDYWQIISNQHQQKVRMLAEIHKVTIDCAFRNIVRHLKYEQSQLAGVTGFEHFLTARHIERMIDLIAK